MPSGSLLSRLVKNAKKIDDPLTPLIDRYLLERDRSKNRYWEFPGSIEDRSRPPGRLSPSSICGCERQATFKYLGVKGRKFIDPESEITFDDGKWRHLRLDWMCRDMEAVLGPEIFRVISVEEYVIYPELHIAGSLDISVAIYGIPWVIDFKGVNQMGFEWIFNKGKPKDEHVHQIISYMKLRRIRRGMIWYECKNTGRYLIFVIEWSPETWREVKQWCRRVIRQMSSERLPIKHPDCRDGRYLFGRCPYSHLCFGGKTEAQLERFAYRNFEGVEALWKEGLESHEE